MTPKETTKADYLAALKAVQGAESALHATRQYKAHQGAMDRLSEVEENLGVELFGFCEATNTPIFADEPYGYDPFNELYFCEAATPTWRDMLNDPSSFCDAQLNYHTPMTAKAAADAHVASGGSLDDKMGLIVPEGR